MWPCRVSPNRFLCHRPDPWFGDILSLQALLMVGNRTQSGLFPCRPPICQHVQTHLHPLSDFMHKSSLCGSWKMGLWVHTSCRPWGDSKAAIVGFAQALAFSESSWCCGGQGCFSLVCKFKDCLCRNQGRLFLFVCLFLGVFVFKGGVFPCCIL